MFALGATLLEILGSLKSYFTEIKKHEKDINNFISNNFFNFRCDMICEINEN